MKHTSLKVIRPLALRLWLLVWAVGGCLPLAQAQAAFEARTDTEEVVEGSSFDVSFVLTNAQGEDFKMPALGALKNRRGVTETFGTQLINGRGSTTQSWILRLDAPGTGTYTIGPASVTIDGKTTLQSKPITIRVVKPKPISGNISVPPGSDGQVFLVQQLDPPQAVVGQQVTWRLLLCSRLPIEQGHDLLDLPDFAGFFHREKRHFNTRSHRHTIGGKKYDVRTLYEEALWPQEPGNLTVGQSAARVLVERTDPIGSLVGPMPVVLRSVPVVFPVKPLPQPAPPGFIGAVGRYTWEVKADKTQLSTDDALTLTITLQGDGYSRQVTPPALALPAVLEAFDPKTTDDTEQETTAGYTHQKVVTYAVLPKLPGRYALWPEWSFYDPDSNRYRRLVPTDSIRITVVPGQNFQVNAPPADTLPTAPVAIQPGAWEQILPYLTHPGLWLGLLLMAVLAFVLLYKRHRPAPSMPTTGTRQQTPPTPPTPPTPSISPTPPTLHYLTNARKWVRQPEAERQFYDAIYHALLDALTRDVQVPVHQLHPSAVRQQLTLRRWPEPRIAALLEAWQTAEQVLFAGQSAPERMAHTLRQAEMALGGSLL